MIIKELSPLSLNNLVEGCIYTIISAGFIAIMVWIYSWIRNRRLESSLAKAINPNGIGVNFDPETCKGSFSLQIHNYSTSAIRVRAVVMLADKFHVELRPAVNKSIYQTPMSNEAVRKKFRRQHLSKNVLLPDDNPHAMLLPSKTMGVWEVDSDVIGSREWVINRVYMVVEYATVFGNAALVRIKFDEGSLKMIKDSFEILAKAIYYKQPSDLIHRFSPSSP